jgi:hypothetical protein
MNTALMSYEQILAWLRTPVLSPERRNRLYWELHSRDRAEYNQWVSINGGEFK